MSVLVDEDTRVVVQGITGGEGKFHTRQMVEYGTNVVAGAVPGKGGQEMDGVPVYDTVEGAVEAHDADASVVFNIFGGITRGDEVAEGINAALEAFDEVPKPVVVRLAGTNAQQGMEVLNTDLVTVESTLEDAVKRAVAYAEEVEA